MDPNISDETSLIRTTSQEVADNQMCFWLITFLLTFLLCLVPGGVYWQIFHSHPLSSTTVFLSPALVLPELQVYFDNLTMPGLSSAMFETQLFYVNSTPYVPIYENFTSKIVTDDKRLAPEPYYAIVLENLPALTVSKSVFYELHIQVYNFDMMEATELQWPQIQIYVASKQDQHFDRFISVGWNNLVQVDLSKAFVENSKKEKNVIWLFEVGSAPPPAAWLEHTVSEKFNASLDNFVLSVLQFRLETRSVSTTTFESTNDLWWGRIIPATAAYSTLATTVSYFLVWGFCSCLSQKKRKLLLIK